MGVILSMAKVDGINVKDLAKGAIKNKADYLEFKNNINDLIKKKKIKNNNSDVKLKYLGDKYNKIINKKLKKKIKKIDDIIISKSKL